MLDYKNEITKIIQDYEFSGVCLVKQGGKVVYHDAHGYAHRGFKVKNTIHTRFDTASITKLFTTVATLQLVDKGKIQLEDKLLDILKLEDTTISKDVAIYHLLTHTSGIGDDVDEDAGEDYEELFKSKPNYTVRKIVDHLPHFIHNPSVFRPGEGCRYNNAAFILLGLVIEKITHENYMEYIKSNIFERAGMTSTEFCSMDGIYENVAEGYGKLVNDSGIEIGVRKNIYSFPPIGEPSSGAHTTANDLNRFFLKLKSGEMLSKNLTEELFNPKEKYVEEKNEAIMMGYGFEFLIDKTGEIQSMYKEGFNVGVENVLSYHPESDTVIVILANTNLNVMEMESKIRALV
ncbi:serine hydrolase domain-containing protein [Aquibacillus rhizosphaerae]|uniref:Serine hydrolase domain-containing protein n=1 Tax=Aquibacillus rhizosphaerae TaxID=3051431 RepID=A0ABT7L1Y7_9BACI|nr:serine hydrolase domain-containing protein [Aquibacillus sp. LR5S19]MDL4839858.1 serine hydrolase domain-containing protein [Aquibacillus sp. LR5S19]